MQAVRYKNLWSWQPVRPKHFREDVDELDPGMFARVVGYFLIYSFHAIDLCPAGGIWRDGNIGNASLRQRCEHFLHKFLEIREYLFRGFPAVQVITPRIHND